MPVAEDWALLLFFFYQTKKTWIEEEKKYLLTNREIRNINSELVKVEEYLLHAVQNDQNLETFKNKGRKLRRLIQHATRKMGLICVDDLDPDEQQEAIAQVLSEMEL
jgi:hypothetical protein